MEFRITNGTLDIMIMMMMTIEKETKESEKIYIIEVWTIIRRESEKHKGKNMEITFNTV